MLVVVVDVVVVLVVDVVGVLVVVVVVVDVVVVGSISSVSQAGPVKPSGHWQYGGAGCDRQTPPFWHGSTAEPVVSNV